MADLATLPTSCVRTHPVSQNAHGISASARCGGKDAVLSIVIDSKLLWPTREKMHLTISSRLTFRGIPGESVVNIDQASYFLKPDCGSMAPGASVAVQ